MTKAKRRKSFLLAGMLLVVSILFGTITAYSTAKAYTPEGEKASTDTVTGYFMDIPLNGEEARVMYKSDLKTLFNLPDVEKFNFWTRTERQVTLLLTFPDVTYSKEGYKPEPLFVSGTATLEFPSRAWSGTKIKFLSDLHLNIRESYYNYFMKAMGGDWTKHLTFTWNLNFTVMYIVGSHGFGVSDRTQIDPDVYIPSLQVHSKKFYKPITMSAKELHADVNDPDSPNFDLGGNGGTVTEDKGKPVPIVKSVWDTVKDFLYKVFGWNLSSKTVQIIFWCIVGVVGLAVFMTLMRAIFGHR